MLDNLLQGGGVPFKLDPADEDEIGDEERAPEEQLAMDRDREDMEALIRHQLRACKAPLALMRGVHSGAQLGETYARRGIMTVSKSRFAPVTPPGVQDMSAIPNAAMQKVTESETMPSWEYVPNWYVYRDLEATDMDEGRREIYARPVSAYWMRQRAKDPFFLADEIKEAIQEAKDATASPDDDGLAPHERDLTGRQNKVMYIERWGRVPRSTIKAYQETRKAGAGIKPPATGEEDEDIGDEVECLVGVYHDRVVRFAPTKQEDRPGIRVVWQECLDETAGRGIADNCEEMQSIINGVVQTVENLNKLQSNPALFELEGALSGGYGGMFEGKTVKVNAEDAGGDIRKAVYVHQWPDSTAPLIKLLEIASQFLEEDSMVPDSFQGIQDDKPGTATAERIRLEKGTKYTGGVLKNYDALIEAMVSEFYEWNMLNPDVAIGKRNYKVKAIGYASYQARVDRVDKLTRFLEYIIADPELRIRYKVDDIVEAIGRALDLDVDDFERTDQEVMALQQQQQVADPNAEKEAMRMESEIQRNQGQAALTQAQIEDMRLKRQGEETDRQAARAAANAETVTGIELKKQQAADKAAAERAKAKAAKPAKAAV